MVQLGVEEAVALVDGRGGSDRPWAPGYPDDGALVAAGFVMTAAQHGRDLGAYGTYEIIRRSDGAVIGAAGFQGGPDDTGAARGFRDAVADPHRAGVVGLAQEAGGADHRAVAAADDLVGAVGTEVAAVLGRGHHEAGRHERTVVGVARRPRTVVAAAAVDQRDRLLHAELHQQQAARDDVVGHGPTLPTNRGGNEGL